MINIQAHHANFFKHSFKLGHINKKPLHATDIEDMDKTFNNRMIIPDKRLTLKHKEYNPFRIKDFLAMIKSPNDLMRANRIFFNKYKNDLPKIRIGK